MPQKIFIQAVNNTDEGEKCFLETAGAPRKSSYFGSIPVVQQVSWSPGVYNVTLVFLIQFFCPLMLIPHTLLL